MHEYTKFLDNDARNIFQRIHVQYIMNTAQTLKNMDNIQILSENDPFYNDWTIINNSMDLMEVRLNKQHDTLRSYEGLNEAMPKWQARMDRFRSFRERITKLVWSIARIKKDPDDISDHDINYCQPEQPSRPFNEDDLYYLRQHLDNNIRILEGKYEVGERNYLDSRDSGDLNRFRFMRKIVDEWQILSGKSS